LIVESNPENSKVPCENIKAIGKLLKDAMLDFATSTDLMSC
jgi:mannitol-1-phosphate/altronate dehydrogenase